MSSQLFKECFGNLPKKDQEDLKRTLNGINKICNLPKEE